MSKRNVAWLVVIVVVGVSVWAVAGFVWGLAAAAGTLILSEAIERVVRRRRRAARGHTGGPSLRDAIGTRRR
ncbi:MAG TPA: hypothetical protein VIS05_02370 [Ilumatobacter sp.]